jgi:hypothetical protein
MRIFQNIHLYPLHLDFLAEIDGPNASFNSRIDLILAHGICGTHLLSPIVERSADAFLTSTSDQVLQNRWAAENGLKPGSSSYDILAAQLEHFKPDVFYTQGPSSIPEQLRLRLPGLAKVNVCWKAPPDFHSGSVGFDIAVNNFPSSFKKYYELGFKKVGHLTPSFDPVMEEPSKNSDRQIDLSFAGSYSRHHRNRSAVLNSLEGLDGRYVVKHALMFDRLTKLANSPAGYLPIISKYRAPRHLRRNTAPPVSGKGMYELFGNSKIVLNTGIDLSGSDRGNIRCFEIMGCGALMLTDVGTYPEGMIDGETMCVFQSPDQIPYHVERILADDDLRIRIASQGLSLMKQKYSKEVVWKNFQSLIG